MLISRGKPEYHINHCVSETLLSIKDKAFHLLFSFLSYKMKSLLLLS